MYVKLCSLDFPSRCLIFHPPPQASFSSFFLFYLFTYVMILTSWIAERTSPSPAARIAAALPPSPAAMSCSPSQAAPRSLLASISCLVLVLASHEIPFRPAPHLLIGIVNHSKIVREGSSTSFVIPSSLTSLVSAWSWSFFFAFLGYCLQMKTLCHLNRLHHLMKTQWVWVIILNLL